MPSCYCLIVSESSSNDAYTSQVSLFKVIEDFGLDAVPGGVLIPFETISWWTFSPEEYGLTFVARIDVCIADAVVISSPPVEFSSPSSKFRLRLVGFPIPDETGDLIIKMALKNSDGDWIQAPAVWLMSLATSPRVEG